MGYTKSFNKAFKNLMALEGGYTIDTGGPTKSGITLRSLIATNDLDFDIDHDGDIDHDDLCNLTIEKDKLYYFRYWWKKYSLHEIYDDEVSTKILDLIVNVGPKRGIKIIQEACNSLNFKKLKIDGIIGPKTLARIEETDPNKLLAVVREFQKRHYHVLAENSPSKYAKYLKGWVRRAES